MDAEKLNDFFEAHEDEFLKFDRVPGSEKRSNRPDLHAFLLLDEIIPGTHDMVSSAEHDQIWLEVSPEDLAEKATEAQIIDLIRCGLMYDTEFDSLSMFV